MAIPTITMSCNSLPLTAIETSAVNCELDTTTKKFGSGSIKILQGGYIDVAMPSVFNLLTDSWTVEHWFSITDLETDNYHHLINADNNANGQWAVYVDNTGKLTLNRRGGTAITSTVAIANNEWHHLRVTHTGNKTLKAYLDGNLFATNTFSAAPDSMRIGKQLGESTRWYTGNIDEIAFTILDASNVAEYSGDTAPVPTEGYPDEVRSPGVVIDGLFLSTSKPTANQKGLLVNNKFFIPFAEIGSGSSGGTSAEYYKCASMDTSAKTWSGYKAVFDSTAGTWSFESNVTEGLTYTSVTPVVGGIYSADALVGVSSLYDKIWNSCNAYYKLDGHCRDSVNVYDGIPNNITFVDGKIGRSAHTTGYGHYISLPNEVSVKGRTQVSYSGWCFIESTLNKEFYIITEIANSSGYTRANIGVSKSLLPYAGVRTVATGDTGSFQKVTGTSPISTGTWYFLCGVFDLANGNITLYVNGVSVGSLNVTASSFVDSDPNKIRIGDFEESGSGSIRVDEVGIWSKALSADEVSELYNNGAGKFL